MTSMLKLTVYVPDSHLEAVKQALFGAGAGRLGNYDQCCWQVMGEGQFRPLLGAQPFLGKTSQLETVPEWRLEVLLPASAQTAVVQALRQAHPYETPAFDLILVSLG